MAPIEQIHFEFITLFSMYSCFKMLLAYVRKHLKAGYKPN